MNGNANNQERNQTIMELLLSTLISAYRLSPIWWALQRIRKLDPDGTRLYSQNFTDVIILLRLGIAILLVNLAPEATWSFVISLALILELFFAYFAHFFSDEFNSAGPRKVTSLRRSMLIVAINYLVFVLLYSTIYLYLNNGLSKPGAIYSSAITITTLGCDNAALNTDCIRMIAVSEVLVGVFLLTFILGTILGWGKTRGPTTE